MSAPIWQSGSLAKPLRIGSVQLETNLLLAPIAGYCDLAFRTVCREWGGVGLACTDLLSPQGLLRGSASSLDLAKTNDFDKPVGMQLYGSDPEIMAAGARWAVEHGATVIDINMGCPVDKVTKKDGGSALLTNLDRAVGIAKRVREELDRMPLSAEEWRRRMGVGAKERGSGGAREGQKEIGNAGLPPPSLPRFLAPSLTPGPVPLTCKMRICWHNADFEAGTQCSPHLARMLADVGVAAVTVHGRTTEMKFSGVVQLAGIKRVVDEVNGVIPVIGNGDVKTPQDAARMLRETGCDGVMIGRAALTEPWLFRSVWHYLQTGEEITQPSLEEKIATIRRYFRLMQEHRDDRYAIWQIQRRISWFAKKMAVKLPDGRMESVKPFKEAMRTTKTPAEVEACLDAFVSGGLRGGAEAEEEVGSEA
jgi:tRNA-dihydrouridine synthase